MSEIEIKKQSFDIQKVSNEIEISDSESLSIVFEILKKLIKSWTIEIEKCPSIERAVCCALKNTIT